MPINLACTACGARYQLQEHLAGRSVRCKCGLVLAVPSPGKAPATAAPPRPAGSAPRPSAPGAPGPRPGQPPAPNQSAAGFRQAPQRAVAPPRPVPPKPVEVTVGAADLVAEEVEVGAADAIAEEVEVGAADLLDAFPKELKPFGPTTFAEEEVPPKMRQGVEEALEEGETITWLGRPSMKVYGTNAWGFAVIGVVLVAIGVGLPVYVLRTETGPGLAVTLIVGTIGAAFTIFGLIFVAAPWWVHRFRHYRHCYVVTSRRALLCGASLFRNVSITSYDPGRLMLMKRRDSAWMKGAGDLIFESTLHIHSDGSTHRLAIGFLHLEDVAAVEKLLRQLIRNL
jgi:hypothetical protein